MNTTTVILLSLFFGIVGALLVEAAKFAWVRAQASRQPPTRVLDSYRAAPAATARPANANGGEIEHTEAVSLGDIAGTPIPAPPVFAPVNAAISEASLQADSAARQSGPIMIYSQENSVLSTIENSDEVDAVLQSSRGAGWSKPPANRPARKPAAPTPAPSPARSAQPAAARLASPPRPELPRTLEEKTESSAAGGVPLWAVYAVLGGSILLALIFGFLALQPFLAK